MEIEEKEVIDLIQCYYSTRDSDDLFICGRADEIVDNIAEKYGFKAKLKGIYISP